MFLVFLGYTSTIDNMQNMQNQMFTILQDVQKKVNEMYIDWKATGFGSSYIEKDTKWIEVSTKYY